MLDPKIVEAMKKHPATGEARRPCSMAPFGCNGTYAAKRAMIRLADGTELGLCLNVTRHVAIAREAGLNSEAKNFLTWMRETYKASNKGKTPGMGTGTIVALK